MKITKASYTIEATLIFSMVIYVVIFIVFSAFYMHNQAVLYGAAYETAIYGSTLDKSDSATMKQKMEERYQESIGGRLISVDSPELTMNVNGSEITVRASAVLKTIPLGFIPDYNGDLITVEKKVSFSNPTEKVRIITGIDKIR